MPRELKAAYVRIKVVGGRRLCEHVRLVAQVTASFMSIGVSRAALSWGLSENTAFSVSFVLYLFVGGTILTRLLRKFGCEIHDNLAYIAVLAGGVLGLLANGGGAFFSLIVQACAPVVVLQFVVSSPRRREASEEFFTGGVRPGFWWKAPLVLGGLLVLWAVVALFLFPSE